MTRVPGSRDGTPEGETQRSTWFGLARDVGVNVLGRNGQYVVTLVTLPLIARTLGTADFGLYALSTSAFFFGSAIVDLGLSTPLAGRVPSSSARTLGATRRAYLRLRLVVLAILLLSGAAILFSPRWLYLWLGLVSGGISSAGEEWVCIGRGQFGRIVAFQWSGRLLFLVVLVAWMSVAPAPYVPVIALGVGALLTALLSWRVVGAVGVPDDTDASPREPEMADRPVDGVGRLARFGWSAMVSRVIYASYVQSSPMLVSVRVTDAGLGLFSAASRATLAVQAVLESLVLSMIPRMAARRARGDLHLRTMWSLAATTFGTAALAAALLTVAADPIVDLMYGPDFAEAVPVLRAAAVVLPFAVTTSMMVGTIILVGQTPRLALVTYLCGALVAVLGVVLLPPGSPAVDAVWRLVAAEATAMVVALTLAARVVRHGTERAE